MEETASGFAFFQLFFLIAKKNSVAKDLNRENHLICVVILIHF